MKDNKNALIFTLYGNVNYGNKLQNYAVQTLLKEYNISSSTVVFNNYDSYKTKIKNIVKKCIPYYRKINRINNERKKNFLEFDKYINKINVDKIDLAKYDYLFIGSDQVWNSNDFLSRQLVNYLNNIKGIKKISISASVGNTTILDEYKNMYIDHFNSVNHLSVRENAGKELIEKLTNKENIEVLLDPTLLIDKKYWDEVSQLANQNLIENLKNKKYILKYFLGSNSMNDQRNIEIERIAKENDCIIIDLYDKYDPYYKVGPSEFVWLEKNAFLVCTDSFHSSAFALIFNTPFIVYKRENKTGTNDMISRIETLLNVFDLNDRFYNGKINENLLISDYDIEKILEKERKKAKDFIIEAIK